VDLVDMTGRVISVVELLGATAEEAAAEQPLESHFGSVAGRNILPIGGGIAEDPMPVEEADYQQAEQAVPLQEESSAQTLRQPRGPTAEEKGDSRPDSRTISALVRTLR